MKIDDLKIYIDQYIIEQKRKGVFKPALEIELVKYIQRKINEE